MAYSTAPKVRRDGKITLKDGTTPTPISLVVDYEEGNFSFEQTKADRTIIRDRGTIKSVRKGDDQPLTGSFTIYMRQFTVQVLALCLTSSTKQALTPQMYPHQALSQQMSML